MSDQGGARSELFILGAAGHAREVAELVRAGIDARGAAGGWTVRGLLDDDPHLLGSEVGGHRVLGSLDHPDLDHALVALGVGYPETKQKMLTRVEGRQVDWPILVHPAATLGPRVDISEGSFIQAGVVLTTEVEIGRYVTLNIGATLSHDVQVEDLSTVSPGAHVGGAVRIGQGAFIGIGASVVQGITIGAWSVVGAGAVVIEDVEPNTVVAGVPARVINRRPEGWQHG